VWWGIRAFVYIGIAVALAVWLAEYPGWVTIDWLGWRLETYFALLAVLLTITVIVLVSLWMLVSGTLSAPGSWFRRRADRRREQGYRALTHGLAAVAAGDAEEARRQAQTADKLLNDKELTRLLSAQAAALAGDDRAAARYFGALRENADTRFIGLSGLMRQAVARGDEAHALELAEEAYNIRPDAAFVAMTRLFALARARRWFEAQRAVYEAVKHNVLDEETGLKHRAALLVERAREALAADRNAEAVDLAGKASDSRDGFVPAVIAQARAEAGSGKPKRATRLIEDAWSSHPHPDLAAAFLALVPDEAADVTLRRVTELARRNPDHPETAMMVAEAALAADAFDSARQALEKIEESDLTPRSCRLWARVEFSEGGDGGKARRWLERAAAMDRDPAWTCGTCGAIADQWTALCGHCEAFDSLSWARPAHVTMAGAGELDPDDGQVIEGDASHPEVVGKTGDSARTAAA